MNELLFIVHAVVVALFSLVALFFGVYALVALVCVQCILANLFVVKQMTFFGFTATCSDAFTIGTTLGLNMLQEYFGKDVTKKTIWINFFLLLFYVITSQIHVWYVPNGHDVMQKHFVALLSFMPRIALASLLTYMLCQFVDYQLYGFLRKFFVGNYIIVRNYFSIALSQFLDTVLFSFLGLYGLIDDIWSIIIVSYCIKLAAICIAVPFVGLSKFVYHISTEKKEFSNL